MANVILAGDDDNDDDDEFIVEEKPKDDLDLKTTNFMADNDVI